MNEETKALGLASAPSGPRLRRSSPPMDNARPVSQHLALLLLLVLALVPMPLGSNRPAFVAAGSVAVGLIGAWYFIRVASTRAFLRVPLTTIWPLAVLVAGLVGFLVLQVLPRDLFPDLPLSSGVVPVPRTISYTPAVTGTVISQVLAYGTFALLMMQASAPAGRALIILDWMFGLIVAYAALGLFMFLQMGDTFFGIPKQYYLGSLTGTFINRNSNATFLAFGMVAGAALLSEAVSGRSVRLSLRPIAIFAGLGLVGVALLLTNSRMGIFAGLVASLLVLVVGAFRGRYAWWKWAVLLVGAVLVALWAAPIFGAGVLDRLLGVDDSWSMRLELYRQVLTMIVSNPWVGFGAGSFEWTFPLFHEPTLDIDVVWDRAHSTYLTLWVELGLIGGTLPILIVVAMAMMAGGRFLMASQRWSIPLAALGVALVAAIHSLVDFSLEMPANMLYLLAFLAVGVASGRQQEGQRPK